MEALRNAWRRTVFKAKSLLGVSFPELPVIWAESRLKSFPSAALLEKLSSEDRSRMDEIVAELQVISRCYHLFPEKMCDTNWLRLLQCQTMKQRLDYVRFLKKKETAKEKDRLRKENLATAREAESTSELSGAVDKNSLPLYLPGSKIERLTEERQWLRYARALTLDPSPAVVVDGRFLSAHSPRGLSLAAFQIGYLVAENKMRRSPWPVYLCNVDLTNEAIQAERKKHWGFSESSKGVQAELTSKSYLDLFPRENIVYLSPHATEELDTLDGTEFFVIGGIVDRVREVGIHPEASLVAAQEDGVLAKRLPLDRFVKWKSGSKSLTITAVYSILYDVYSSGGDWEAAFKKHIPVRNVRAAEEKNEFGRRRQQRFRDYDRRILEEVTAKLARS